MAFTMRVTEEGEQRPAAVCDRCSELATPDGMVLWGRQAIDPTSGRSLPFTSVVTDSRDSLDFATVAVACDENCANLLRWMYSEAGIQLEYVTVAQFVSALVRDFGLGPPGSTSSLSES